jgi:hypothetical protein
LNEIFDISFRQEFLLLDRYLYVLVPTFAGDATGDEFGASTREQHNINIEAALFSNGPPPLSTTDLTVRQATLYTMFQIMRGWTAPTPMVSETGEDGKRLAPCSACSKEELDATEYYLAYFYIFSFAECFRRAPLLPHYI